MTTGYHIVCGECGAWWGPYPGTTWRTPREQALCALGGIDHRHDVDGLDLRAI